MLGHSQQVIFFLFKLMYVHLLLKQVVLYGENDTNILCLSDNLKD